MPRDFLADKDPLKSMPPLQQFPVNLTDVTSSGEDAGSEEALEKANKRGSLHPYIQMLTDQDIESCLKLEEATFPQHQRCSREKFAYRFSKCGELCLGLFTSAGPDSDVNKLCTAADARPVSSDQPERKAVLLGQITATKTDHDVVKDEDMEVPNDSNKDRKVGHNDLGHTVGLHSFAIVPEYQDIGLGKVLMKAYIQRIQASGIAERIALITYERLIPFYEKLGFEYQGKSDVQYGGESWHNMIHRIADEQDHEDEDDG
ncbi:MAG: hypothetical protein M1820_007229 [Bogoriella megaspora]|nr:MAG: hypothetical protein M1820_007229 [Bogoriella megaspora]